MESLNVKNINDEKIFNVIDPNGQGEVVNRIRPISISINQKAETMNDQTNSTINLAVYWNDTWKSILDLTFDESLRQEYGKLVEDLTKIQKDIDMKQYKDAETKTADFLKYVANLSSKYTAIPEKAVVAKTKNDFIKITADKNSVKVAISDKLLNFMLKKYAKVDNLDYTKSDECFSTNKFSCLANHYDIYYHSPEIFKKQAYMTVVKDNKVVGSYKVNYDQFSKFAAKFMLTPQKLGYSKDRLAGYMKTAEVVMQNIFFDSVDEAKEWQEMVDEKKKMEAEEPAGEETTEIKETETKTKTEIGEGKSESPAKEEGGLARTDEGFASDEIPESEPRQQDQQGGGQSMGASRRLNLLKKKALKKKAKVGWNAKPENELEEKAVEIGDEVMSVEWDFGYEIQGLKDILWEQPEKKQEVEEKIAAIDKKRKEAIEKVVEKYRKEFANKEFYDLFYEHLQDNNAHTANSIVSEFVDNEILASKKARLHKKAGTGNFKTYDNYPLIAIGDDDVYSHERFVEDWNFNNTEEEPIKDWKEKEDTYYSWLDDEYRMFIEEMKRAIDSKDIPYHKIGIEDGYYEGLQLTVEEDSGAFFDDYDNEHEDEYSEYFESHNYAELPKEYEDARLDAWNKECDRVAQIMRDLGKDQGWGEYTVAYRFSNGETGYSRVKASKKELKLKRKANLNKKATNYLSVPELKRHIKQIIKEKKGMPCSEMEFIRKVSGLEKPIQVTEAYGNKKIHLTYDNYKFLEYSKGAKLITELAKDDGYQTVECWIFDKQEEKKEQSYDEIQKEIKNLDKQAIEGDVQEQDIVPAKTETKVYLQSSSIEQEIGDKKYSIDTENADKNKLLGLVEHYVYDYDLLSKALDMAKDQKPEEFAVYTLSPDKQKILNIKYIGKDEVYDYKPNANEYGLVGVRDTGFIDTDYQLQPMISIIRSWNESKKHYSNVNKKQRVSKKAEEQTVEEKIEMAENDNIVKGKIGVGDIVTICIDKLEYPEESFKYTELIGQPLILMENDKEDINKVIVEQTEYPFQRMTVNKDDIIQYAELKGADVVVEDTDGDEMITTFEELPIVAKQCKIKSIHKAATKKKANLTKKAINSLEDVAGLIDTIVSDYDWYGYFDSTEVGELSLYDQFLADVQKDEKGTIEKVLKYIAEDDDGYTAPEVEQLKEYYNAKFGGK